MLYGVLIGLAAGNYECPTTGSDRDCSSPGESAAAGAILGAIGGGGLGLLIGSSHTSERWRAMSPEQIRVAWRQQRRTVAIMAVIFWRERPNKRMQLTGASRVRNLG
jgi:hypothetical protein